MSAAGAWQRLCAELQRWVPRLRIAAAVAAASLLLAPSFMR